jgi:hypothetical protein
MIQVVLCIFVPVQASPMIEATGDKGLYVSGVDEKSVFSNTAHAFSNTPCWFSYAGSPERSIASLTAPRMVGFTRETFSPFYDLSSCTFEVPVRAIQESVATRWLLQYGTLRTERDACHLMTNWNGTGLVRCAAREDGERPLVHHIQGIGNSSGNISHFFLS